MAVAEELREFHRFVAEQLTKEDVELSPEQVLDAWRIEHPPTEELAASAAIVQQALVEADQGEGRPLSEVCDELRAELGLPK
jgi:hypothetical protein